MKKLVSTLDLDKDEWLRYRKKGIGGSDAGAICGLNPYATALTVYRDKISDNVDNEDNEAMRQGRELEEYVARRFMEAAGKKVRRSNTMFYDEANPFMPPDGSDIADAIIAEYYPDATGESLPLTGFDDKLHRREELVELIERMETEKKQIEQEIKLYLKDAESAENERYKVSWKNVVSNRIDGKRLKEERPEIYNDYQRTIKSRRFTVKAA